MVIGFKPEYKKNSKVKKTETGTLRNTKKYMIIKVKDGDNSILEHTLGFKFKND